MGLCEGERSRGSGPAVRGSSADRDDSGRDAKSGQRSEAELLRAADEGDEDAFGEFCVRCIPALVRTQRARCQSLGIPPHMAEEFANETLVRAVQWLRNYPGGQLSRNWLFRVAHNVLVDWLRRHRGERQTFRGDLVESVVDRKADVEGTSGILEYFSQLPPRDREILELVLLEGHTPPEAAEYLGIQAWSAYKRYERALKRLRDLLG
jgi:RNA polymerase sigma factor (sigma-70 family)